MATRRLAITPCVVCVILISAPAHVRAKELDRDVYTLIKKGRELSAEEATALEKQLETAPDDLAQRTQLLGYYWTSRDREARAPHVLWLIEHYPAAAIADLPYAQLDPIRDRPSYAKAKDAWLKQVERQGDNASVLGNAAAFFLIHDRDQAESLLVKAQVLEPDNSHWADRLGHLYQLQVHRLTRSGGADAKEEIAKKSLQLYEKALQGATHQVGRSSLLIKVAQSAFEAGDLQRAKTAASDVLKNASDQAGRWNTGNAIHHGNVILGRIALHAGDVAQAKERLLAAGNTTGSPQLNSFGPNMMLAKELLEQGEQEIVLEYFDLCSKFWDGPLTEWTAKIKQGHVPDFRGNLFY